MKATTESTVKIGDVVLYVVDGTPVAGGTVEYINGSWAGVRESLVTGDKLNRLARLDEYPVHLLVTLPRATKAARRLVDGE